MLGVGTATVIALLFGVSAGVWWQPGAAPGFINNFLRWFSFLGLSMPNFWIAMLLDPDFFPRKTADSSHSEGTEPSGIS